MEPHLLLLIFCMAFFTFQLSTKIAVEWCENKGDYGSPLYVMSVTSAIMSVFIGARSLIELSLKAEKELKGNGKTKSDTN